MPQHDERVFTTIQRDAFDRLTPRQRETTNLYIDKQVYRAGETIGNAVQKITVETPSVLVFADDHPQANFGHDCRYLLYHPENGTLQREILARFPPSAGTFARKLAVFNEPVKFIPRGPLPPIVPDSVLPQAGSERQPLCNSGGGLHPGASPQ